MKELLNSPFLIPYAVSNLVGLLLLIFSLKRPRLARVLFVLLFSGACYVNLTTALTTPDFYLAYADNAIPVYARFINGWFKAHLLIMVPAIAVGQGVIACCLLLKGGSVRMAFAGIILFLLCIAPLGIGSAFPFSLTVALAAWYTARRDSADYIWKFRRGMPAL